MSMYHYTLTSYNTCWHQPQGMETDSSPRGPAASAWSGPAPHCGLRPLRKSLTATSDDLHSFRLAGIGRDLSDDRGEGGIDVHRPSPVPQVHAIRASHG